MNETQNGAALTGTGSTAGSVFRLMNDEDVIEAGDQFLGDDAKTWTEVPIDETVAGSWMIGVKYSRRLKPMRRRISAPNEPH